LNKIILIACIFVLAVAAGILVGPVQLTSDILYLRIIRVGLGIFAGGILAFCGAVMQGLFGNPLVEPYTLGAASGAALGTAVGMMVASVTSPVFAFLGALGVSFGAYSLARVEGGVLRDRLILAGVIMSFLCSSLVMIILVLGRRELYEVLYLLMGYLGVVVNGQNRAMIIIIVILAAGLLGYLYRYHREFDIMSQGVETAVSLGIDIQGFSTRVFFAVSLLIGMAVSIVGAIGFVGLIIPHMARMIFGPRHVRNLPASFLLGATFLLLADTLSRTITVYELPVGVVTSLVGVPFFIYLYRAWK
jgi:iron complex transport system permease protein